MKHENSLASFFCLLCFITLVSCATPELVGNASSVQGHWVGRGDIIVTWCNQDQLDFDIIIDSGGHVKGKIGDARIVHGRLYRRSSLMKASGNESYVIRANLEGFLVREEKIARDSITLMFDLVNDTMEGEMNTSGSKCGTRDRMYMKVANIILSHVDE